MINLIWAMDQNCLIGKDDKLPWKIPTEIKYFSKITSGNTVLMGSKTFESIGRPLKNRHNIVITRNKEKYQNWSWKKNLIFTDNLKGVLKSYKNNSVNNIFIIGGRKIFQQTFSMADCYYISVVKGEHKGDIYFPFPDLGENKKQKSYLVLVEELFKDLKLIKKEEFSDFTAYIYINKSTT